MRDADFRRRRERVAEVRAYLEATFPGHTIVDVEDMTRMSWAFRVDAPRGGPLSTLWIRTARLEDDGQPPIEQDLDQQRIVGQMKLAGTKGVTLYVSYLDPNHRNR